MSYMNLKGKRALVTGGAVRIGRAITEALQAAGAEVVVHYLSSAEEAEAKESCLRVHEAMVTLREDGDPSLLRRPARPTDERTSF